MSFSSVVASRRRFEILDACDGGCFGLVYFYSGTSKGLL